MTEVVLCMLGRLAILAFDRTGSRSFWMAHENTEHAELDTGEMAKAGLIRECGN